MLILPRNIQAPCLLRRGMLTIFLHLGIFQPAKWGFFNRRKLGNIQPALTQEEANHGLWGLLALDLTNRCEKAFLTNWRRFI